MVPDEIAPQEEEKKQADKDKNDAEAAEYVFDE
jgi:hypothetical protein